MKRPYYQHRRTSWETPQSRLYIAATHFSKKNIKIVYKSRQFSIHYLPTITSGGLCDAAALHNNTLFNSIKYIMGNDSTRLKFKWAIKFKLAHLNFNLVESLPLILWSPDVLYSRKKNQLNIFYNKSSFSIKAYRFLRITSRGLLHAAALQNTVFNSLQYFLQQIIVFYKIVTVSLDFNKILRQKCKI